MLSKVKIYDLRVQVQGGGGGGGGWKGKERGGVYIGLCWLRKENCIGEKESEAGGEKNAYFDLFEEVYHN